jgi:hypothetical protein
MVGCRGRAYELRAGHCPHRSSPPCEHYRADESIEPHTTQLTCGQIIGDRVSYPMFISTAKHPPIPADGEGSDLD